MNRSRYSWKFGECPKCGGDLYCDGDKDWTCLQCGFCGGSLEKPIIKQLPDYRTKEFKELMRLESELTGKRVTGKNVPSIYYREHPGRI